MIKVFATNETTSFRWFELPPMEASAQRRGNALQDLVSTIASEESITRQVEVLTDPELEWTVHQVEIDIKAAKAASAFSAES